MNQDHDDEMAAEVDFTGGVRGKYLARYQRWKSVTSATGPVNVVRLTSSGEETCPKIVVPPPQIIYVGTHVRSFGRRIAPENQTAGHAV